MVYGTVSQFVTMFLLNRLDWTLVGEKYAVLMKCLTFSFAVTDKMKLSTIFGSEPQIVKNFNFSVIAKLKVSIHYYKVSFAKFQLYYYRPRAVVCNNKIRILQRRLCKSE